MHTPETKYFLYYPFQNDAHNKVDVYAETAEDFFKPLIDEWKPKEDQSRYADYTASDLMVAKGVVETVDKEAHSVAVNFTMKHCMALAVIEMPGTLYHITSYNSKRRSATSISWTVWRHNSRGMTNLTVPKTTP